MISTWLTGLNSHLVFHNPPRGATVLMWLNDHFFLSRQSTGVSVAVTMPIPWHRHNMLKLNISIFGHYFDISSRTRRIYSAPALLSHIWFAVYRSTDVGKFCRTTFPAAVCLMRSEKNGSG